MAKQRFGINDGYRGTVGTVIGYQWRGKWCLRARPRFVRNPRTEAQQRNRGLFKQMVRLAGSMKEALRKGLHYNSLQLHLTECNLFCSLNKQCFALAEETLVVDYADLLLAQGNVAPVGFGEPVSSGSSLSVPFAPNLDERHGEGSDEVYLYAWCPDCGEGLLSMPAYRHSGEVSLTLPEEWQGHEVHLYGFALDRKGRASDSLYLGCLLPTDEAPEELSGNPSAASTRQQSVPVDIPSPILHHPSSILHPTSYI